MFSPNIWNDDGEYRFRFSSSVSIKDIFATGQQRGLAGASEFIVVGSDGKAYSVAAEKDGGQAIVDAS